MADQHSQAFSVSNLKRCWGWIRSNPEAGYKNYFRDIYSSYEIGIDRHLQALSEQLRGGGYQPSFAAKLFFPKGSGLLRPWSLLTVEDQLAYLAAVSMVAARLYPKVHRQYFRSVYGNLYAGKNSTFFYQDWREGYRAYTAAMRDAYADGYPWTASFDLTACFDSIDHHVLRTRMVDIGVDTDLADVLLSWLKHWSAHDHESPVFMEHGIPQGPLASGLLSEVVLSYFDTAQRASDLVYLRYVDDIRLFGSSEDVIRRQLIDLDLTSKRIGLFPQSGKIKIHEVADIEDEVKSVSKPPEDLYDDDDDLDQELVHSRLKELSRNLRIDNETRFKYVLARAHSNAALSQRLIQILRRYPHLHGSIGRHLERNTRLSKAVSRESMALLREYELYPAFTASLVRVMRGRVHPDYKAAFTKYCKAPFAGRQKGPSDPELRAALASVIVSSGSAHWAQVERLVTWKDCWWVRAVLLPFVRVDQVGTASAGKLANALLRDTHTDPACVATAFMLEHGLSLERPYGDVNTAGQHGLREAKLIGRLLKREDPIGKCMTAVLGRSVSSIDWREILAAEYKSTLPKVARWRAYASTDATSWVNITDTIMDIILSRLFAHDVRLGGYTLGMIGSVLRAPTGKLASVYPSLYSVAEKVHKLRLESDLSHPVTRTTGRPTSFIRFKTMQATKPLLARGLAELWSQW